MNNMNNQTNHYHQGNPYHTFENVYTANHEHMIAPNMHDHMNMPNHYHTGKKMLIADTTRIIIQPIPLLRSSMIPIQMYR